MTTSFLCIDDEEPTQLNALLDRLRRQSVNLEIVLELPLPFDDEVERVSAGSFDGIMLDLRLDEVPSEGGERVGYRAGSLAQELRTRMAEGRLQPCPIVLWSIDAKLRASYWSDETAHDLFDKIYYKSRIVNSAKTIAVELQALADGYKCIEAFLRRRRSILVMLGLSNAEAASLDPRIGEFGREDRRTPVHEYARYILRELIQPAGPLVSDEALAARMGVSREASEDWTPFTAMLADAAYKGPFCQAWNRWWWFKIESWWDSSTNRPGPLRQARAIDRVNHLRKVSGLDRLIPAEPIDPSYSDRFWVVCQATDRPLDPIDGVLLERTGSQSWQEAQYVSLRAVLERKMPRGLRIHPLEKVRIREIIGHFHDGKN